MTISLQDKLQRIRKSKFIEEFKKSLTGFECFSVLQTSDFAPSLAQAITDANKMDTPRQGEIACSEKQENIFAWVERMFVDQGSEQKDFICLHLLVSSVGSTARLSEVNGLKT